MWKRDPRPQTATRPLAIDPIRSIATLHRNSPSISRPFRRSTGTAWCQSRLTLGLCAQDDGSIKTAFTISQEIEGRKRSWHDLELNALKCEIFAAHAPTDEEAAPERLALVDVDLEILKPLSLAVGENELSGSLVFSRLNHASLARVVSDFNLARDTALRGKCAYDVTVAVFGALPLRLRGTHAFDLTALLDGGFDGRFDLARTSNAHAPDETPLVCFALPTVWESSTAFWRDGGQNRSAAAEWEQFFDQQL